MFEALVAESEKFQERTDERLAEMRKKATGAWNKLKKVPITRWDARYTFSTFLPARISTSCQSGSTS